MSLIKSAVRENELRSVFRKKITKVAEKLRENGILFFSMGFDEENSAEKVESWYVPYPDNILEFVSFENTDIETELMTLWESQGLKKLTPLIKDIVDLSKRLEMPLPSDDADVSPFIYVMF